MAVYIPGLRETVRALEALGVEASELKDAMSEISDEGVRVVRRFIPKRSGKLAASARGNRAKGKALVRVGRGKSNLYAAPVQWGWGTKSAAFKHGNSRTGIRGNYEGAHYKEKTEEVMEEIAPRLIEENLNKLIRKHGFDR